MDGIHADWIIPDWPAPARVHALCTTRVGGVSVAPWDECNLGEHVGDDPRAVGANRALLDRALNRIAGPVQVAWLHQVHGTCALALPEQGGQAPTADASGTRTPGLACTVLVADCLPVLLTDRAGRCVAAAHAGWRGLAAGVLEQTLERFWPLTQAGKAPVAPEYEVIAWLGPCIGPRAFEVGTEVRAAFCSQDPAAALCFSATGTQGKYFANLGALARQRLVRAGVTQVLGNDGTPHWCTVGNSSRFFSHRRDAAVLGSSGRMAACIWIGA